MNGHMENSLSQDESSGEVRLLRKQQIVSWKEIPIFLEFIRSSFIHFQHLVVMIAET
jgi:hypothetical protein